MPHLLVTHEVKDYGRWRPIFDNHDRVRREFGCLSTQVFRDTNNPNSITMLMEWDSFENADRFLNESNLRDIMADAGVISQPTVSFLNET
jgi:quinol monooxygenase YgiN